jgi:hypothetical protein
MASRLCCRVEGLTRPQSTETQGNLGHLESAAGLAGLVKVLITARHRLLLPSGSFSKWSPKIDAAALNLRVVTEVEPLVLPPESPAFIGINSFGGLAHGVATRLYWHQQLRWAGAERCGSARAAGLQQSRG